MPFTAEDAKDHTEKADTPKKQEVWAKVANQALAACEKDGGEDCEASAIKQANAAVDKIGESTTKGYGAFTVKVGKERKTIGELIDHFKADGPMDVGDCTTFAELHRAKAKEQSDIEVTVLAEQYKGLFDKVMALDEWIPALRSLTEEFIASAHAEGFIAELEGFEFLEADSVKSRLSESDVGSVVGIMEAGTVASGGDEPLIMQVAVIEPGWGRQNKEGDEDSRHYYPAEVLARDIGVFKGAKMHETDHKERSNKTWTSTILDFVGFTETGGPIAKVGVHDPDFAKRAINLEKLGQLDKLVPSILGDGISRKGMRDGKKGWVVEALTKGYFVDWVSRTAAGGRTVALGESEEVPNMEEEKKDVVEEAVEIKIEESEEVKLLDKADAKKLIEEAKLTEFATKRLTEAEWADEDALKGAISEWQAETNRLVGAGKPVGNAVGISPAVKSRDERIAEADKLKSGVNAKWSGVPIREA